MSRRTRTREKGQLRAEWATFARMVMCGGGGSGAAASEGRSPPRPCGPTDQPQQGPCEQQEEEEVGGERGDDCDESRGVLGGGVREGGLSLVQPRGHLYLSSPGDQFVCPPHARKNPPGESQGATAGAGGGGARVDVDGESVGSDKPKSPPTDTDDKMRTSHPSSKRSELVVPHATGKGQSAAEGGHTDTAASAAASASSAAPPPPPPGAPVDNKALIHKIQVHGSKSSTSVDPEAPAHAGSPRDGQPLLGFIDDWAAEKGMDTIRQKLTAEETADTDWRDTISTPRLRAIIEQLLEGESTGPAAGHKVATRSTRADGTGASSPCKNKPTGTWTSSSQYMYGPTLSEGAQQQKQPAHHGGWAVNQGGGGGGVRAHPHGHGRGGPEWRKLSDHGIGVAPTVVQGSIEPSQWLYCSAAPPTSTHLARRTATSFLKRLNAAVKCHIPSGKVLDIERPAAIHKSPTPPRFIFIKMDSTATAEAFLRLEATASTKGPAPLHKRGADSKPAGKSSAYAAVLSPYGRLEWRDLKRMKGRSGPSGRGEGSSSASPSSAGHRGGR
ncbi:unnamed protein product [Vitrella brassicaformis CCMP3155]|uniref:Uncharacterized protein n=1 Tax=Vitrella brassicaformis (strain CCMP3155) TaxID=1169540 RepID=A0A0G4ED79_VITBC|nr:unnamed protein product [Vitrella brassicaformis CCMP3155]|eukprot:CEL93514.1 unnamed protein product [Vitrella brassicaformis CCMP3155]